MVATMANNGLPQSPHYREPVYQPQAPTYIENGREYENWIRKYMFPCDEAEKDRMDIYHKLFLVARREQLHSPLYIIPTTHRQPQILDLGCGTGIWAIDMADKYPTARVHGVDLSFIQPAMVPPNCSFSQRDVENVEHWGNLIQNSWDLIHIRMLNGAIRSWPMIYKQVYYHLIPGTGWLEHVEIDLLPRCDDGSLPPSSNLVEWCKLVLDTTQRAGQPMAYNPHTRTMLESQGFTEVQEQVIRVPFNAWPADPQAKDIGRWYHLGLTQGLEALTMAPLTRQLGWNRADVDRLVAACKQEICLKRIHAYCNMHIWIARRPAER